MILQNQTISNCTYAIKESDTIICPGTSLKLNAIQTSATKSVIPQDSLVGFWPFNGNANDESGKGNNGVSNGAILTTDRCGKENAAYNFDGKSWIEVPNSDYVDSNQVGTISFWIQSKTLDPYSTVCKSISGDSVDFRIFGTDQHISFIINGKDYLFENTARLLDTKDWNHLVLRYVKDSIDLFINGNTADKPKYYRDWPILRTTTLKFGFDNHGGLEYLTGKLDDIAIWKRTLTNEEIQKLYANGQCGCDDTLSNNKFVWSDGQKGRAITVNPDTTTTYMLTVTDGTTIHKDSIRVTIGGDSCFTCTYAIREQDTTICQGTTLQLHADLSDTTNADIPKEGLIGYWPFNGNANDESGNGNHGVVDKATLVSDKNNKPNSAYQFYKSGSKIAVPDAKILNNPFVSISFWLKTTDSNLQSYIYKSQEGTAYNEEYVIVSNYSKQNSLEFSVKNGSNCTPLNGWSRNIKDVIVFDGLWHHITATYDGIFSKIYIDTILVSEIQKSFFPIDSCPGGEILFGKGWNNDANFDGVLDDIAIWNRAITFNEVKSMYKVSKPKYNTKIPQDGLIGYWPFNGNANDESGNGNHGKIIGELELTIDRFDKSSSSYNFTGNGHIQLPSINLPSFTLNAWVNRNTNTTDNGVVISKHYSSSRTNSSYLMYSAPEANNYCTPKLYFTNTSTNPSAVEAKNSSWCDSNWHMITGTLDTSWLKIYFDGVLVDSISGGVALSTDFPTLIGSSYSFQGDITNQNFGKIDDVAFYNRSLTGDEISRLFKTQSSNCRDTLSNDNFTWSTGEKGRTISVKPDKSTMYTLAVERGKVIHRDTIHVTVLESPTPDIFGHVKVYERQVNHSYYTPLNDSSTYEWSITGNGKLSSTNGGSSILVDFKEPGYAYLTVTETNKYGCKKDTTITIRIYRLTDVSESEMNADRLQIYPNPISESSSVQIKAFIPPTNNASISLVDLLGKELRSIQLEGQDAYQEASIPFSIEGLTNGVYMIQLQVNGDILSKKLIINR